MPPPKEKIGVADLAFLRDMPVEIGGRVYNYDVAAFLVINPTRDGLNEALARIPGDFAHWAFLESLARIVQEETEAERSTTHARLYRKYDTTPPGSKSPTVDAIKSAILLDPEYAEVLEKLRRINHAVNNMMTMRQAMTQKKDVILSIAHNFRAEREANIGSQLDTIRNKVHAARGQKPA